MGSFQARKPLKSLAGAGGFEPPHGGTKIRCLTAWLRPIEEVENKPDYTVLREDASVALERERGANKARLHHDLQPDNHSGERTAFLHPTLRTSFSG